VTWRKAWRLIICASVAITYVVWVFALVIVSGGR